MLQAVIARARRRLLWNALARQLAIAAAVELSVLVVLLVFGTDVVAGTYLIVLPLTYLICGIGFAWRKLPASSPTAQILDCRLKLPDTLSTALFYSDPQPGRRCAEEFRKAQNEQATKIAATINLRETIPVRMPRAVYLSAALAVAASGLLVIRYGTTARLDLRPPIASRLQQMLENAKAEMAKLMEELQRTQLADRKQTEESGDRTTASAAENSDAKPSGSGESNQAESGSSGKGEAQEKPVADTFAGEQDEAQQGNQQLAADSQSGSQQGAPSQQQNGSPQNQQQQGSGSQSGSSASGSSMVNKMKDSLANLLSALKPPSGGAGGQQAMKAQEGRTSGNNRKQGATESGASSGEAGEGESSKPGNALAGGAGQAGKSQAEKQQGTGAGNDEGSKEIRAAQQLAAMGKIGTIFGKRSENISGEFTVEAPSGPQNLNTPYARRSAAHASVETTAIRDEVPQEVQEYVQHYYELIRQEDALAKGQDRVLAASNRRPRAVKQGSAQRRDVR